MKSRRARRTRALFVPAPSSQANTHTQKSRRVSGRNFPVAMHTNATSGRRRRRHISTCSRSIHESRRHDSAEFHCGRWKSHIQTSSSSHPRPFCGRLWCRREPGSNWPPLCLVGGGGGQSLRCSLAAIGNWQQKAAEETARSALASALAGARGPHLDARRPNPRTMLRAARRWPRRRARFASIVAITFHIVVRAQTAPNGKHTNTRQLQSSSARANQFARCRQFRPCV